MTDKIEKLPVGKILTAICEAQGKIKTISKDNKNNFDKYDFASIDNFLTLVNPICAEVGLIFHMQEGVINEFAKKGRNGESSWLRMTFEITPYHTSGETLPTVFRSVEVQRTGAQAFGSAQSYVLKQFLRSLFLIPTGDKDDADYQATDNGTVQQSQQNTTQSIKKNGNGKTPQTRSIYKDLSANIEAAGGDLDALQIWAESDETKSQIAQLPADWQDDIRREYKDAKIEASTPQKEAA